MIQNEINNGLWIGETVRVMLGTGFADNHDGPTELFVTLLNQVGIFLNRNLRVGFADHVDDGNFGLRQWHQVIDGIFRVNQSFGFVFKSV